MIPQASGHRLVNWGGNFECAPARVATPTSLEEIADALAFAAREGLSVRPVGRGYSYTPLVHTDALSLSLDRFVGLESVDRARRTAVVRAGTRLRDLTRALAANGLALGTMGDIDRQSLAGALATGTHGTGLAYGSLSSLVESVTLVTPRGEVVEVSPAQHPEWLDAVRVSLGLLGVVARVTLALEPAQTMLVEKRVLTLDRALATLDSELCESRHYELFWVPGGDLVYAKRINPVLGEGPRLPSLSRFVNEAIVENATLWAACKAVMAYPTLRAPVLRAASAALTNESSVRPAHEAYATPRLVKHQEVEYAVPLEAAQEAIRAIARWLPVAPLRTIFPLEVRFVARESAWLSPSHGGPVAYLAAHTHVDEEHHAYFREFEAIARGFGGRPHWGKLHTATAADLRAMYPRWGDFLGVREALDPDGALLNPYLADLLGLRVPGAKELRT